MRITCADRLLMVVLLLFTASAFMLVSAGCAMTDSAGITEEVFEARLSAHGNELREVTQEEVQDAIASTIETLRAEFAEAGEPNREPTIEEVLARLDFDGDGVSDALFKTRRPSAVATATVEQGSSWLPSPWGKVVIGAYTLASALFGEYARRQVKAKNDLVLAVDREKSGGPIKSFIADLANSTIERAVDKRRKKRRVIPSLKDAPKVS